MAPFLKSQELYRKAFHVAGILFLPISWLEAALVPWALLIVALVYWGIEALAAAGNPIPFVQDLINHCKRPERKDQIDRGPFYLAVGVGLPFLFFPVAAAQIGLIHVCLADAAASIVPHYLPRRWLKKLPHAQSKSWPGSAAFFVVAFLGTLFFVTWWQALVIALIGTLLESFPPPDIDNLTVPIGVALMVTLTGWVTTL